MGIPTVIALRPEGLEVGGGRLMESWIGMEVYLGAGITCHLIPAQNHPSENSALDPRLFAL